MFFKPETTRTRTRTDASLDSSIVCMLAVLVPVLVAVRLVFHALVQCHLFLWIPDGKPTSWETY
jgi:hypothetical protein